MTPGDSTVIPLGGGESPTLIVTSFEPTSTGFIAEFNQELDRSTLNLYDSVAAGLGPADVVVHGGNNGPVFGSLVVDSTGRRVTFVKSGGPLVDDAYSVTLRSAANGIRSISGAALDGDRDGISADDFNQSFSIESAASVAVRISDFVRGPGQSVNVPPVSTNGIPLSLSVGSGATDIELQLEFDPEQLVISDVTLGAGMPTASVVTMTSLSASSVLVQFSSPVGLTGSEVVFANLQAHVPEANASQIYSRLGLLDLNSISVRDAGSNAIPAIDDDAFHVTLYIGDVTANGRVNGSDASQVARFAAFLDSGFAGLPLAEPFLLADVSGNGRINAADATWAALIGALFEVPGVPPVPAAIVIVRPGTGAATGSAIERPVAAAPDAASHGGADVAGIQRQEIQLGSNGRPLLPFRSVDAPLQGSLVDEFFLDFALQSL